MTEAIPTDAASDSAGQSLDEIDSNVADTVLNIAAVPDSPSPLFATEESSSYTYVASNGLGPDTNEHTSAPDSFVANESTETNSFHQEEKQEISSTHVVNEEVHDNRLYKQRTSHADSTVGVTHVDERAPNINLRFFRGLARANRRLSQRSRNRVRRARWREAQHHQDGESNESRAVSPSEEMVASVRPMSNIMLEQQVERNQTTSRRFGNSVFSSLSQSRFFTHSNGTGGEVLINATLVEEQELEYAVAEELSWWQKHAKVIVPLLCFVVIALVGGVTGGVIFMEQKMDFTPSEVPSQTPSAAPSMDPRQTLQIVQERGYLLCGLSEANTPETIFRQELCRAIAAVVLQDPDSFKGIEPFNYGGRWAGIQNGGFDLQIQGDTHNVQREVQEELSFSTPYYYDGAAYSGNATFVNCAYKQKRYDECAALRICVLGTNAFNYVSEHFSPDFYTDTTSWSHLFELYSNGGCNVIAGDRQATISQMWAANLTEEYVVGNATFTNEPLAIVTRNDESRWSDIINWVMQALFYGEKHGAVKDESLCMKGSPPTTASELNYMNAVYCVGNYAEIFRASFGSNRNDINRINRGTAMLYVTPFGELNDYNADDIPDVGKDSPLHQFWWNRGFRCGIIVQKGCDNDDIATFNDICGVGVDLCTTIASSIFYGDTNKAKFYFFQEEERALANLHNETLDVLFGLKANFDLDFGTDLEGGVTYSMPYLYGNETGENDVTVYSAATRDDAPMLASYVNFIILATVFASAEGITQEHSSDMPTTTLFGKFYLWSLKDAIHANGNYDEIYESNFGIVTDAERGRNILNKLQTPQLFYNPGL